MRRWYLYYEDEEMPRNKEPFATFGECVKFLGELVKLWDKTGEQTMDSS